MTDIQRKKYKLDEMSPAKNSFPLSFLSKAKCGPDNQLSLERAYRFKKINKSKFIYCVKFLVHIIFNSQF